MSTESERTMAVVDRIADVLEEDSVFGKRWGMGVYRLTEADLDALRQGRYIALDVMDEYVAYLAMEGGELGRE